MMRMGGGLFPGKEVARPTGFEPATCSFGGCHSIHLSYGRTAAILQDIPEAWGRCDSSVGRGLGRGLISPQMRFHVPEPSRSPPSFVLHPPIWVNCVHFQVPSEAGQCSAEEPLEHTQGVYEVPIRVADECPFSSEVDSKMRRDRRDTLAKRIPERTPTWHGANNTRQSSICSGGTGTTRPSRHSATGLPARLCSRMAASTARPPSSTTRSSRPSSARASASRSARVGGPTGQIHLNARAISKSIPPSVTSPQTLVSIVATFAFP